MSAPGLLAAEERTMANAYRLSATVLPGHRIEVTAPDVSVGRRVEVIVFDDLDRTAPNESMMQFLDRLPRRERTEAEWREIDRQFSAERDAWDH